MPFIAGLLALVSAAASGQVFDAANDFSVGNGNPNGVWSYGVEPPTSLAPPPPGPVFTPYTKSVSSGFVVPDGIAFNNGSATYGVPAVFKNTGSQTETGGSVVLQAGQLALHPGPDGTKSVVRWTAPAAGLYYLATTFTGVDNGSSNATKSGTTTDVHVLQNGSALFDGLVNSYGDSAFFSLPSPVALSTGDKIDFVAGYGSNGNFFNDSTALSATIWNVPAYPSRVWHVSPSGNDSNDGLTPATAWQTVGRANAAKLSPGDSLLFEGGKVFGGNLLISASGAPGAPIQIGSYGTGAAVLQGGDSFGIRIQNCQYIRVRNLTLQGSGVAATGQTTNVGAGLDIYSTATAGSPWQSIYADSLSISGFHDGVVLHTPIGTQPVVGYNDVRVTHCTVSECLVGGIYCWGGAQTSGAPWNFPLGAGTFTHLYIGYCDVHNIYGDPNPAGHIIAVPVMVFNATGSVVERCTIRDCGQTGTASGQPGGMGGMVFLECDHCICQFSECYGMVTHIQYDGCAFDLDGGCSNCILQYNYSHDNEGSGYQTGNFQGSNPVINNTIRYNISQNDAKKNAGNSAGIMSWAPVTNGQIYNNTVYISGQAGGGAPAAFLGAASGLTLRNNLFFANHQGAIINAAASYSFAGNGYWRADGVFNLLWGGTTYNSLPAWSAATGQEVSGNQPLGIFADPKLQSPGAGGAVNNPAALGGLAAYNLLSSSPLIGGGINLFGILPGGPGLQDYHGTVLQSLSAPSIGAVEAMPFIRVGQWTLRTDDTILTLAVDSANELFVVDLENAQAAWNWAQTPSRVPLLAAVSANGTVSKLQWQFQGGSLDASNGSALTLTFANASPALILKDIWEAQPGKGPVRHSTRITNNSSGTLTIYNQETFDLRLTPRAYPASLSYISDDAAAPDPTGVYTDALTGGYTKSIPFSEAQDYIPYAVVSNNGSDGVYLGCEWSIGRISIAAGYPAAVEIKAGSGDAFRTNLAAGATFEVPAGFVGAHQGDLDGAGNSLRPYLHNYVMPPVNRSPGFPKVQWNSFDTLDQTDQSKPKYWKSFETNYRPLVDMIARMGFEEVMLDVGWWEGAYNAPPSPPRADPANWPSGMKACADYAHQKGLRFGLYWNNNTSMTTAAGIQTRESDAQFLFANFGCDVYRSDATNGNVLETGSFGAGATASFPDDLGYWETAGYYGALDWLQANLPAFNYEDCANGGHLKDFGIMRRALRISQTDTYSALANQQAFYDASYCFPPVQLAAQLDSGPGDKTYWFRSCSLGAPLLFPNPLNWSASDQAAVTNAVSVYTSRIRPLQHSAQVYHIFPRPDDIVWTGIEYYDPGSRLGVVYIFKPNSGVNTQAVKLRGLNPAVNYTVSFQDKTNASATISGASLMTNGINVSLGGTYTSELMWISAAESSWEKWLQANFTQADLSKPEVSDPLAEPAEDGVSNLLKYASGLNPWVYSSPITPILSPDGTTMSITYQRDTSAAEAAIAVEQSTDLINWSPAAGSSTVLSANGFIETVQTTVPVGSEPTLYLRLQVSLNL